VIQLYLRHHANGREVFQKAFDIQWKLLEKMLKQVISSNMSPREAPHTQGSPMSFEHHNVTQEQVNKMRLDLADALCNMGSLCMDWANREGNTFGEGEENRAKEAEVAFLHAFQIRKEVLSSSHPLTMQTKEFYNKARILAIKTMLQDGNDRQSSPSPCENASSNDSVANTRISTLPTFAKDQVSKVEETAVQHDDKPLSTSKTLDNQHDVSRAFSNQVGNFIHLRNLIVK